MRPEELARALHESFRQVTPKFYGYEGNAPDWESVPEKSKEFLIAVCADVLGYPVELKQVERDEVVPTKAEFEEARAVSQDETQDGLSDWEAELRTQIDRIDAKSIRRAQVREPFRK